MPPVRKTKPNIIIAADHPLTHIIGGMLARRGDHEGVAQARGLAIVEMLIDGGWLDRQAAMKCIRQEKRRRAAKQKPCI